jgi:hypothetical protein
MGGAQLWVAARQRARAVSHRQTWGPGGWHLHLAPTPLLPAAGIRAVAARPLGLVVDVGDEGGVGRTAVATRHRPVVAEVVGLEAGPCTAGGTWQQESRASTGGRPLLPSPHQLP